MFLTGIPQWSIRTGSSTVTSTSVDPYDDDSRLVNHTSSFIDPDSNPSGHAAATFQNYPTATGTANSLFGHSLNPLRKVAPGVSFAGMSCNPRRLNNIVSDFYFGQEVSLDRSTDYVQVSAADNNLDFNLYNNGYPQAFVRVGYNLVEIYAHFYTDRVFDLNVDEGDEFGINDDDYTQAEIDAGVPDIARDDNIETVLNDWASNNPTHFLCADGKVRAYSLESARDLHLALYRDSENDSSLPAIGDWNNGWEVNTDRIYFRFVGTPPSEDVLPIFPAATSSDPTPRLLESSDSAEQARGRDRSYYDTAKTEKQFRPGYIVLNQNRVVAIDVNATGSGNASLQSGTGPFGMAEPGVIHSGDSGSPVIAPMADGEVFLGRIASQSASQWNMLANDDFVRMENWLQNDSAASAYRNADGQCRLESKSPYSVVTLPDTLPVKPKRTEIAGRVPTATQLKTGELAINSTDKTIFTKKVDGTVVTLLPNYSAFVDLFLAATGTAAQQQATMQSVVGVGAIGTRVTLNDSYSGFIEAPSSTKDYILDASSVGAKTLVNIRMKAGAASGTVKVVKVDATSGSETDMTPAATIGTSLSTTNVSNPALGNQDRLLLRFSSSSSTDFEFTVACTVTT